MSTFETWWSHYESQFSEPLGPWDEELSKEAWDAAIEAAAELMEDFGTAVQGIPDTSCVPANTALYDGLAESIKKHLTTT